MWFRVSAERRLAANFLVIIGVLVFAGGFGLYSMFALGNLTLKIYRHPLVVSNASLRAALGITKMHRDMRDVVLETAAQERAELLAKLAVNESGVYAQLDLVRANILGAEGIPFKVTILMLRITIMGALLRSVLQSIR
ncbi:MAG: hypothetical protein JXX29_10200, partial [Deltaproteobacteria bacterium]|nr:hypothetical protein [Deltaproteobacteria bacterium]MBN2672037.1 hypothetical protein [Deltaproteobacteria bacterium]